MVGQCIVYRALYSTVRRCTLCGRAVQCVVGLCKVCHVGVMCVRAVHCLLGRCTAY